MSHAIAELIRRSYRPEVAHRHVAAISQHHRIQASPGYRAAAQYVADQLEAAGVQVAVRRYPADGVASFWSTPGFLEWACQSATLHLLDERGAPIETLCDFAAIPISVIQRSIPVEGDFEVVALAGKGGRDASDYQGLDVRGKLVLTGEPVTRIAELAVRERGAAGILFDGVGTGARSELDVPDARQYTSFWWAGQTPPDTFGFAISSRRGRQLRAALNEGRTVRVRAAVDSRFYAGSFEVVDALIPGPEPAEEEIVLVSHLCHPQPGAHDNGSGAAALIETAATLARLIADGRLPPPSRGIRFLWPPEMTGTFAWLVENEDDVRRGRWIAGLNLDMVGADQAQSGSTWELVALPQAGAAFADHLLSWLREPFLKGQRHTETAFSSGSDHYILADPSVGIPTPMLIQWPDKFYHTSADTPDKVSPDCLERSGALAATYAYWLATAGLSEALWLGHLMVARFAAQAARDAAVAVEICRERTASAPQTWTDYTRRNAFRVERMSVALGSLTRLAAATAAHLPAWRDEVAASAAREEAWARTYLDTDAVPAAPRPDEPWRSRAQTLTPMRRQLGPIDVAMVLQTRTKALRQAFWRLSDEGEQLLRDNAPLMQYWADGRHTVAEIADRVAWETGNHPGELALRYFELLAETGLVDLL